MLKECLLGAAMIAGLLGSAAGAATAAELATAVVQSPGAGESASFDGVVEAVRQTVVSAQVSGAVVAIDVKVGDVVKAGQVLARIDARAAEQNVAASDAQVQSARATLEVATKEFDRQKQLFEKNYTSQAALERAEAQFKATQAQVSAQLAQAGAARAQSGFFVVKAPYGGVIADVPITLGDMAMPGRALLTMYDPAALRVTAAVPQTDIARIASGKPAKIQFPGLPADRQWVAPVQRDRAAHGRSGHAHRPDPARPSGDGRQPDTGNVCPGLAADAGRGHASSLRARQRHRPPRGDDRRVCRSIANGHPILRQVRLGRAVDDTVEVLSGVTAGERVALDPQAAARER